MAEYKFTKVPLRDFTYRFQQKLRREKIELESGFSIRLMGNGFTLHFKTTSNKDALKLYTFLSNYPGYQCSKNLENL